MGNPWDRERPLTAEEARDAIASCFPSLETRGLRFLGSGWEFDAWLTTDGWVVRFPRRAEAEELFVPEQRVHQLVRSVLPSGVGIPLVPHFGKSCGGFPWRIAAHPFIPGIPADEVNEAFIPHLAVQLGKVLGAIHTVPEADARAAGVTEPVADVEGEGAWYARARDLLASLGRIDPVVDEAVR
jgi:aminoglycoside phosphotransferase (APT) family kinase protein